MTPDLKKIYKIRWRHAKIISTLLVALPFVRTVILNGSLATGKIHRHSDIDFLVVAKNGRLFTARMGVLFMVWLTGLKRSSDSERPHAGQICLNYFLTDNFLIIPHNRSEKVNKYCADNYSKSVLLAGEEKIFNEFMETNEEWMSRYLSGKSKTRMSKFEINSKFKKSKQNASQSNFIVARSNRCGDLVFKNLIEKLLTGNFGNRFENFCKRLQLKRINSDPRTKKYPTFIVANDLELRFHPPKKGKGER